MAEAQTIELSFRPPPPRNWLERLLIRLLQRPAVRDEVCRIVEENIQQGGRLRRALRARQRSPKAAAADPAPPVLIIPEPAADKVAAGAP